MSRTLTIGTVVDGRYRIEALVNEGGMGTIFSATEIGLERKIALKCLHAELLGDEDSRLRFEREGRLLAELSHANILRCYRFGIWRPNRTDPELAFPYIAMEFLEGSSLRNLLDRAPVSPEHALEVIIQVCNAMEYAHSRNIVHRDLKPTNIMLLRGSFNSVKVVDFGLAKLIGRDSAESQHLTQTGILIGSVYTMSPEQCRGQKADHRSDIYSLGCVAFEMLTGSPPFSADNPIGIVHQHVNQPLPLLSKVLKSKKFPQGLDAVLQKSMAKLPDDRYQSMASFRSDIELVRAGRSKELTAAFLEPAGRLRLVVFCAITVAALVLGIAALGLWRKGSLPMPSTAGRGERSSPADHRRLLLEREASVERAQHRLDMARRLHQDLGAAASILQQELHALQSEYWDCGEFEKGLAVLDRKLELAQFCKSPISMQTADLILAFDRCLVQVRLESDSAKRLALRTLAESLASRADKIAVAAPPAVQCRLLSSHALAAIDAHNFAEAKIYFEKLRAALGDSTMGLGFGMENTGRTGAKHTFGALVHSLDRSSGWSERDFIDVVRMIETLGQWLEHHGEFDMASDGLRQAQRELKRRFAGAPGNADLLAEYNSLMRAKIERHKPEAGELSPELEESRDKLLDRVQGTLRGADD
ncbi:MAG: protein kinase [Candidatus Obscuribacterales bacterium]|nr:protein kinase [Candidatus Obscuribacterales bacterium]